MTPIVFDIPSVFEGKNLMPQRWREMASMLRQTMRPLRVVAFTPQSREQQCTYHSALEDLAQQSTLNGEVRDFRVWKRATLAAFYEATHSDPDYAPDWQALDAVEIPDLYGEGFHIDCRRSRTLTHNLAGAYLAFLHHTGDERGVKWRPTSLGRQG